MAGHKILDEIRKRQSAADRRRMLQAKPKGRSWWTRLHSAVVLLEPYGIILAVIGLLLTFGAIILDLEDRLSERTFKAWEILSLENKNINQSSAKRAAIEFLNREYDGFFCSRLIISPFIQYLSGDTTRECLVPRKRREALHGLALDGTSLTNLRAHGAKLNSSSLSGARMAYADLSKAELVGANLSGVFLLDANMDGAILDHANLTGAVLSFASLIDARLYKANLSNSQLDPVGLQNADLRLANLENAAMAGANLRDANLTGANLTGVNLAGAYLAGAKLKEANLTGANLTGAHLEGAVLKGAVLLRTNLREADLRGTMGLEERQLTHACGSPFGIPKGVKPPLYVTC